MAETETRERGIPEGISREDVLEAINAIDQGSVQHDFGPSTTYDLIHDGKQYPPKAVLGIAARRLAGRILGPNEFSAGEESRCFKILRALGFEINEKETLPSVRYWICSPGRNAKHWAEFYEKGILAIGWFETDLRAFASKEDIRQALLQLESTDSSKTNDALACWQFVHEIKKGDVIFAKQGTGKVLGYGVVDGDYEFDRTRATYKHVRKMKWMAKGEWPLSDDNKFGIKTLTDVTAYPEFVRHVADKVGLEVSESFGATTTPRRYWVEKAIVEGRPDRSSGDHALGKALWSPQTSTSGSNIYRWMTEVRPGDVVFHFVDNRALVGVSIAASSVDSSFVGLENTDWAGRPAFRVALEGYQPLSPPIDRDDFLEPGPEFDSVQEILDTSKHLFFTRRNRGLELNQGAYLTPAPSKLVDVWDRIYSRKTGHPLPIPGGHLASEARTGIAYWWLNANPKIWNFEETPVGQKQTYTSHNERGNKRQKYKYFQEAKPGDIVIGYVTSPQREIVAICKVTRPLHETSTGEKIEFEKVEQLDKPISYALLQEVPELKDSEPIVSNQGSLFKLTPSEYEVIRSLIDDANVHEEREVRPYTKKQAMKGLFMSEAQFDGMLDALEEKKNLVLQGAPGVGKTFVAKRLAYALIGSDDPARVEMIQFHQSYSYEEFIQGFRPTAKGSFELRLGIFYQFCRRAQRDEASGKPYVFIIDEINRGNLSKILGELMMLIESDKRGKEHAIPLAYSNDSDEKFYIPKNLHLIGLMNTADRSLAMVDYALRRRFRFVTLTPEFSSPAFRKFLAEAGADTNLVEKIVLRMNELNQVICADTKNLGPGYQMGHSYFCPTNGSKLDEAWYRRVIESEIAPLIQEYWFDSEHKVKEHCSLLLA